MFHGSMVALVTPMHADGRLDIESLRALVEFHIGQGTDALVVAGTTGEAGTLSSSEKTTIVGHVVEQANDRLPVIAGSAANSTIHATELTQSMMEQGADAALIMTPAYIKPCQEGLYQHYSHIAEKAALPLILYNVPSRTACDLLPETVARLSKRPNIIGIKDATADIDRFHKIHELCGDSIDIYSGDDITANEWIQAGARGVISVTANVIPQQMASLVHFAANGDKDNADAIHHQWLPLHEAMFIESNPVPVKWAMHLMGRIEPGIRLPLMQLDEPHQQHLSDLMKRLKLL